MDILGLVTSVEFSLELLITISFGFVVLLIFFFVIIDKEFAKHGIVLLVFAGVLFLGLYYYFDHRVEELKAIAKQITDEKKQ